MPDPQSRYQRELLRADFQADPAQLAAVEHLQQLYEALLVKPLPRHWSRLWRRPEPETVRGLYLWGGVGRGKTHLMDLFYESLPFPQKMRTHFHRFMRRVHTELTALKGQKNPLERVADTLAAEARVLCFDEFFVADITDAMILGNLLKALFDRGVVLVAPSNVAPDDLYREGLQRERFLPAIAVLKAHTRTVNIDSGVDYRLRALTRASLYHTGDSAEAALAACFAQLAPGDAVRQAVTLEIEGRPLLARRVADDVIWFDFKALCDGPRSQRDYIVLAREYHAVILSGVPFFCARNDDQARRFIYLVDEFYDRRVKLVIGAAGPLASLYGDGRLAFEFERTVSRLLEMQSDDYLALAHRP